MKHKVNTNVSKHLMSHNQLNIELLFNSLDLHLNRAIYFRAFGDNERFEYEMERVKEIRGLLISLGAIIVED